MDNTLRQLGTLVLCKKCVLTIFRQGFLVALALIVVRSIYRVIRVQPRKCAFAVKRGVLLVQNIHTRHLSVVFHIQEPSSRGGFPSSIRWVRIARG